LPNFQIFSTKYQDYNKAPLKIFKKAESIPKEPFLEKGDSISLIGFGSFKVVERAAREGRNPSTGEKMQISASKGVKFTPGAGLKKRVNK